MLQRLKPIRSKMCAVKRILNIFVTILRYWVVTNCNKKSCLPYFLAKLYSHIDIYLILVRWMSLYFNHWQELIFCDLGWPTGHFLLLFGYYLYSIGSKSNDSLIDLYWMEWKCYFVINYFFVLASKCMQQSFRGNNGIWWEI